MLLQVSGHHLLALAVSMESNEGRIDGRQSLLESGVVSVGLYLVPADDGPG